MPNDTDGKIKINLELDLRPIKKIISGTKKLEGRDLYSQLSKIAETKKVVEAALDQVKKVESDAKVMIDDQAKATYGADWSVIKGDGFKITKSAQGSVYEVVSDKTKPEFLTIKISPNTEAIKEYEKKKNTLPKGIEKNPNRSQTIRITLT